MSRYLAVTLLLFGSIAKAQDMPLHEIIYLNEPWIEIKIKHSPPPPLMPYSIDPVSKKILLTRDGKVVKEIRTLLIEPGCIAMWHGGKSIAIGDAGGKHVWTFRIDEDGGLSGGDRYMPLRVRKGESRSEVSAIAIDSMDRLYAASKEGIQVYDPTGRLCGVFSSPNREKIEKLTWTGENRDELVAIMGKTAYSRRMIAKGPK